MAWLDHIFKNANMEIPNTISKITSQSKICLVIYGNMQITHVYTKLLIKSSRPGGVAQLVEHSIPALMGMGSNPSTGKDCNSNCLQRATQGLPAIGLHNPGVSPACHGMPLQGKNTKLV